MSGVKRARIRALRVGGVYILPYKYADDFGEVRHYAVVARHTVAYTTYDCVEVVDELVEELMRMGVAEVVELDAEVEETDLYRAYRWRDGVVMLQPDEELDEKIL